MKENYFTAIKSHYLVSIGMILFILLGNNISATAQVIKDFKQRTAQNTPNKKIYNVKGDFTLFGNTNITLQNYSDGQDNNNVSMAYVDVDGDGSTLNSSTSELKLSTEN